MGVAISAEGSLGAWYNKVMPPVNRNLEYWGDYSTDSARFGFNRAVNKKNVAIVGSPQAFNGYGRFKGNVNYLRTEVDDTADLTLIAVCRTVVAPPDVPNGMIFISNTNGAAADGVHNLSFGVTLGVGLPARLSAYASRDNGDGTGIGVSSAPASLDGETPTNWAIRVLRTSSGIATRAQNMTRNAYADNSSLLARVPAVTKFCIGSRSSSGTDWAGESDIAMSMIYSTRLTDAELQLLADSVIRPRMLSYGITV